MCTVPQVQRVHVALKLVCAHMCHFHDKMASSIPNTSMASSGYYPMPVVPQQWYPNMYALSQQYFQQQQQYGMPYGGVASSVQGLAPSSCVFSSSILSEMVLYADPPKESQDKNRVYFDPIELHLGNVGLLQSLTTQLAKEATIFVSMPFNTINGVSIPNSGRQIINMSKKYDELIHRDKDAKIFGLSPIQVGMLNSFLRTDEQLKRISNWAIFLTDIKPMIREIDYIVAYHFSGRPFIKHDYAYGGNTVQMMVTPELVVRILAVNRILQIAKIVSEYKNRHVRTPAATSPTIHVREFNKKDLYTAKKKDRRAGKLRSRTKPPTKALKVEADGVDIE